MDSEQWHRWIEFTASYKLMRLKQRDLRLSQDKRPREVHKDTYTVRCIHTVCSQKTQQQLDMSLDWFSPVCDLCQAHQKTSNSSVIPAAAWLHLQYHTPNCNLLQSPNRSNSQLKALYSRHIAMSTLQWLEPTSGMFR